MTKKAAYFNLEVGGFFVEKVLGVLFMSNEKLQVEYVLVGDLKFYERNTRTHSDEQVAQLSESIKEFGFTNPVLIDEDSVLIAGHGRTTAAKLLGLKEIPAIRLSGLSGAQRKALRIADNKLALEAGWDEELLAIELQELEDIGFDVSLTGFDFEELEALINGEDDQDDQSAEAEEPEKQKEFLVRVVCKSKSHQQKVYEELQGLGFECKV